jgi:hypothetical protein
MVLRMTMFAPASMACSEGPCRMNGEVKGLFLDADFPSGRSKIEIARSNLQTFRYLLDCERWELRIQQLREQALGVWGKVLD